MNRLGLFAVVVLFGCVSATKQEKAVNPETETEKNQIKNVTKEDEDLEMMRLWNQDMERVIAKLDELNNAIERDFGK